MDGRVRCMDVHMPDSFNDLEFDDLLQQGFDHPS